MRKGPVAATIVFVAAVLLHLTGIGSGPEAAVVLPPAVDEPFEPIGCTKKIVLQMCQSCSEPNVDDNECKSGTQYKDCSTTSTTCTNGAFCNQHTGIDPCP